MMFDPEEELFVSVVVLMFMLGVVVVVINILFLMLFAKFRHIRPMYCVRLFALLSISYLFTGFGYILSAIKHVKVWRVRSDPFPSVPCCVAADSFLVYGVVASQMLIAAVAADRVFALSDPINYKARNHARVAFFCVCLSTVYTLVVGTFIFDSTAIQNKPYRLISCTAPGFAPFSNIFSLTFGMAIVLPYTVALLSSHNKLRQRQLENGMLRALQTQQQVTRVTNRMLFAYVLLWVCPNLGEMLGKTAQIDLDPIMTYAQFLPAIQAIVVMMAVVWYPLMLDFLRALLQCQAVDSPQESYEAGTTGQEHSNYEQRRISREVMSGPITSPTCSRSHAGKSALKKMDKLSDDGAKNEKLVRFYLSGPVIHSSSGSLSSSSCYHSDG